MVRSPDLSLLVRDHWHMAYCLCCRAILHDPVAYPDPESFNPSRFLTSDGMKINPEVQDPEVAFGYGRRICPVSLFHPAMHLKLRPSPVIIDEYIYDLVIAA